MGCLTKDKRASCVGGTCVKSNGAYHCRCPDMLVAVDGTCTSPACTDEELGLVCSGMARVQLTILLLSHAPVRLTIST